MANGEKDSKPNKKLKRKKLNLAVYFFPTRLVFVRH